VEQAHAWLDDAIERTGLTPWTRRRELLSPNLVCRAVAVLVLRL
jgi:hypothetical protein